MCQHCADSGKIVTMDGSLVKFEPCCYCDAHEANAKRALLEIQELLGEVEGRRHVVSGQVLWITEKYIYTTDGVFNRKWYRLPKED